MQVTLFLVILSLTNIIAAHDEGRDWGVGAFARYGSPKGYKKRGRTVLLGPKPERPLHLWL